MSKHTPGPWAVREDHKGRGLNIVLPADLDGWSRVITELHGPIDVHSSNANLIATAPEMLTMLKAVEEQLRKYEVGTGWESNNWPIIKDLISKAEGRS